MTTLDAAYEAALGADKVWRGCLALLDVPETAARWPSFRLSRVMGSSGGVVEPANYAATRRVVFRAVRDVSYGMKGRT